MALKNLDQRIEEHIDRGPNQSLAVRLKRSLTQISSDKISKFELAILVRQFLLATKTRKVLVPSSYGWPQIEVWESIGCGADVVDEGIKLIPRNDFPFWFPENNQLIDVFQNNQRRASPNLGLSGPRRDPSLEAIGHSSYTTFGQKKAVRLIFDSAPGSTNIVVLPTGSGKTTAFFGPALFANPKLSVLVVPTVSLALDLERRLKEELNYHESAAYHGGLTSDEKEKFLGDLRNGSKWMVITNPEALDTSLAKVIRDRAAEGKLKYFGIDEAHIVASWGDTFRPDFQFLSGFCNELRELSKNQGEEIRVVLFTGTLDQYGLYVLERLFSSSGEVNLVSAQETRPEPSYYVERCETLDQKKEKLLQALRHLPRPLVIYTTLIYDQGESGVTGIQRIKSWLDETGYKRYAIVTGTGSNFFSTPSDVVIENIQCQGEESEDVDIVLATSAFGLGIDIPNIRTVIHACIPESIQRFYQEVGRGGRDGRATVSLLLYEDADVIKAEEMVSDTRLSNSNAWGRWQKMLHTSKQVDDNILQVDLTSAGNNLKNPQGSFNRKWNFYTLSKMALGGLIEIGWKETSEELSELDDDEREEEIAKLNRWISIKLLKANLSDQTFFEAAFKKEQDKAEESSEKSLELLKKVINGVNNSNQRTCPNKIFSETFELRWGGKEEVLTVVSSCGGCWVCGYKPQTRTAVPNVLAHSKTPYLLPIHEDVAKLLGNKRMGAITYSANNWSLVSDLIGDFVEKLHDEFEVRHIVLPGGIDDWDRLGIDSDERWIAVDYFSEWVNTFFLGGIAATTLVVLPVESRDETEKQFDSLSKVSVAEDSGLFVILPSHMKSLDLKEEPVAWKFGKQTTIENAIKELSK
jgi:superfamily II DNA helicase RecQ